MRRGGAHGVQLVGQLLAHRRDGELAQRVGPRDVIDQANDRRGGDDEGGLPRRGGAAFDHAWEEGLEDVCRPEHVHGENRGPVRVRGRPGENLARRGVAHDASVVVEEGDAAAGKGSLHGGRGGAAGGELGDIAADGHGGGVGVVGGGAGGGGGRGGS